MSLSVSGGRLELALAQLSSSGSQEASPCPLTHLLLCGLTATLTFYPRASGKPSLGDRLRGRPAQQRKQILNAVSGQVSSGQVLAIIGPSGAGKTTLLDAVSLRMPVADASRLRLNGEQLTPQLFRQHCCYMPQDDR